MLNCELIKGSTVILVLTLLDERPMYGYELVKEMGSRNDNELQMKEGTWYPSLHKLELHIGRQEKDPKVSIIELEDGKEMLAERTKEWSVFSATGCIFVPPAFTFLCLSYALVLLPVYQSKLWHLVLPNGVRLKDVIRVCADLMLIMVLLVGVTLLFL